MASSDPEALYAARYAIREAYTSIRRLRQGDPAIRETLTRLDAMAVELTMELEAIEPEMDLRSVTVVQKETA